MKLTLMEPSMPENTRLGVGLLVKNEAKWRSLAADMSWCCEPCEVLGGSQDDRVDKRLRVRVDRVTERGLRLSGCNLS
jgi:hypothetical protein